MKRQRCAYTGWRCFEMNRKKAPDPASFCFPQPFTFLKFHMLSRLVGVNEWGFCDVQLRFAGCSHLFALSPSSSTHFRFKACVHMLQPDYDLNF